MMLFRYIIIILFISCSNNFLGAQIFYSDVFDEIFFGPNNIDQTSLEFSNQIIQEYNSKLEHIKLTLEELDKEVVRLKENDNPKKKTIRRIEELEKNIVIAEEELISMSSLIELWNDNINSLHLLKELHTKQSGDKCFNIITNKGSYTHEQFTIESIDPLDNVEYQEYFDFIMIDRGTEWVKKKADRNCLSADPDDCLVWCLVEVPASIQFKDINDELHKLRACPLNFKTDRKNNRCIRSKATDYAHDSSGILRLVDAESNELLRLFDYQEIKCY